MTISRGLNSGKSSSNLLATIAFSLMFLSFASYLSAQGTNFSGTWALNETKSTPSQGGFRMGATLMTITQDGTNLTIESTRKNQNGEDVKSTSKFTLDGKECSNVAFGNSTRKSVVTWSTDKKSLAFAHIMNFERDGQTTEFKSSETWKINDDKSLSIETVMTMQGEERKTTNVYDKK
jgi:hypothetical protein